MLGVRGRLTVHHWHGYRKLLLQHILEGVPCEEGVPVPRVK